jgi:hypothetical protein
MELNTIEIENANKLICESIMHKVRSNFNLEKFGTKSKSAFGGIKLDLERVITDIFIELEKLLPSPIVSQQLINLKISIENEKLKFGEIKGIKKGIVAPFFDKAIQLVFDKAMFSVQEPETQENVKTVSTTKPQIKQNEFNKSLFSKNEIGLIMVLLKQQRVFLRDIPDTEISLAMSRLTGLSKEQFRKGLSEIKSEKYSVTFKKESIENVHNLFETILNELKQTLKDYK